MLITNRNELINYITHVNKGLFTNKAFTVHAQRAGDEMQSKVIESMKKPKGTKGTDYQQSYQLKRTIATQTADYKVTNTRALIGFGMISDLNGQTKRRAQRATFRSAGGKEFVVKLRPEKDLPSWVIMEFGRNGTANRASTVPTFIKKEIRYSPRNNKPLMFGPSVSLHRRAPLFFMTNKEALAKHGNASPREPNEHPGIKEGKFFRDGLKKAIPIIQSRLSDGIEASLTANIRKLGGKAVVTRI